MILHRPHQRRIFAFLGNRALGDFILQNAFASALKLELGAQLVAYYINDRPYKRTIVEANRGIDHVITGDDGNHFIPINFFDTAWQRYFEPGENWDKNQFGVVDLCLTPSMLTWLQMASFEQKYFFRYETTRLAKCLSFLRAQGLDTSRWFCTIHAKEPNYEFRMNSGPARDVNPEVFDKLVDYIIDRLGGQVVRLGDPSMSKFRSRRGFVDLSMVPNIFETHFTSVMLSRFLIATDSGIHPMGSAVGTPTACTNLVSEAFPWNDGDIISSKYITHTATGKTYKNQEAFEQGLLHENIIFEGYEVSDNTLDELTRIADHLYSVTSNIEGPRLTPHECAPLGRSNYEQFKGVFPRPECINARWM